MNDFNGLTNFSKAVMCILLPAVVFPTLSLAILSKPFVFAWVGDKFNQSVTIVTFLALCNVFGFLTYPSSILSMATKKIKFLYIIATVQLITYWSGIAIFFPRYGYIVFAWFELICFSITAILYTTLMCRFLQISIFKFIKIIIVPAILPVIALLLILFSVRNFLPLEKSKLNLFEIALSGAGAALIATFLYYFTSKTFKNYIDQLFVKFKQTLVKILSKKHIHFI
jgi:hypothetical protein